MRINTDLLLQTPLNTGLMAQKELVQKIAQEVEEKKYYLTTDTKYLYFGGWRYLSKEYGKIPAKSQADEMFGWIYSDEISEEKMKHTVIISNDKKITIQEKPLKTITVGPYKAYIIINQ